MRTILMSVGNNLTGFVLRRLPTLPLSRRKLEILMTGSNVEIIFISLSFDRLTKEKALVMFLLSARESLFRVYGTDDICVSFCS